MPESDPIRKKSSQLILPADQGGKHIADKQRVDLIHARILQGGEGSLPPDLAQGLVPVFVNFCLTNSKDRNFSHGFLCGYSNLFDYHLLKKKKERQLPLLKLLHR